MKYTAIVPMENVQLGIVIYWYNVQQVEYDIIW